MSQIHIFEIVSLKELLLIKILKNLLGPKWYTLLGSKPTWPSVNLLPKWQSYTRVENKSFQPTNQPNVHKNKNLLPFLLENGSKQKQLRERERQCVLEAKQNKTEQKKMKREQQALLVASYLLLLTISNGAPVSRIFQRITSPSNYLTNQELWFNQTLDHFSPYVCILISLSLSLSWFFL